MDYDFDSSSIAEEIISKLKELNSILDDLIRRCRHEKDIPDTPSS